MYDYYYKLRELLKVRYYGQKTSSSGRNYQISNKPNVLYVLTRAVLFLTFVYFAMAGRVLKHHQSILFIGSYFLSLYTLYGRKCLINEMFTNITSYRLAALNNEDSVGDVISYHAYKKCMLQHRHCMLSFFCCEPEIRSYSITRNGKEEFLIKLRNDQDAKWDSMLMNLMYHAGLLVCIPIVCFIADDIHFHRNPLKYAIGLFISYIVSTWFKYSYENIDSYIKIHNISLMRYVQYMNEGIIISEIDKKTDRYIPRNKIDWSREEI